MEYLGIVDKDGDKLTVKLIDIKKEVLIAIYNNQTVNVVEISLEQTNQLITHLSNQLQSIGVQVDILKEK